MGDIHPIQESSQKHDEANHGQQHQEGGGGSFFLFPSGQPRKQKVPKHFSQHKDTGSVFLTNPNASNVSTTELYSLELS